MDALHEKYEKLKVILSSCGSAAIAFSAGVDSTLLLKAACEAPGCRVLALTARSCFFPDRESREAEEFCRQAGITQLFADLDELAVPGVAENPANRCYLCKRALFSRFLAMAEETGCSCVCEGSNMDDCGDYRPGLQAISELGIRSPLREAGLYKAEIRALSQELGLPTWDKPSFACLASRFPYGERITEAGLAMVDRAEQKLMELGFRQFRVRIHGSMARIEVPDEDLISVINVRDEILAAFRRLGFMYISLDLQGYRQGSMNEVLSKK